MSFLVIGNDLDALFIGKFLKERGWPTAFLSKGRFDYKSECELVNPDDFKEIGYDYKKGLLTNITKMEVIDLNNNKFETNTNTVLVNLSVYKNDVLKSIKDCKLYESSSFIDKNNENIFIQHGEHGTLIKHKYVVGVNELNLAATVDEPKTKKCIKATLERKAEKGLLTLRFLETGYMWIVNYSDRVAELCIVSDDAEKDFNAFIFDNGHKVIYKRGILLPIFKKDRLLYNRGVFLSGSSALISNNMNFYNLILNQKFALVTGTFCHELMTKKNISYPYMTKDFDLELQKYEKHGKLFWSLSNDKKNELIRKMDFSRFALDFNSCYDNLSSISPYKIKLMFA